MSMSVKEIREWLVGLGDDDEIGVDEGGLCLRVVGLDDSVYCEIGGIPDEDNDEMDHPEDEFNPGPI